MKDRFDAAYYQRHYYDADTRVVSPHEAKLLGDFAFSYLAYLGVDINVVVDFGCGVGYWKESLERHLPGAKYWGIEVSEFLCKKYGWEQGSVVEYETEQADFVCCQGVLQYLNDEDADKALKNLTTHTMSALFLEVLTTSDWEENCDRERTDGSVHLRDESWYRSRLAPHFVGIGGGLFLKRDCGVSLFDLEYCRWDKND